MRLLVVLAFVFPLACTSEKRNAPIDTWHWRNPAPISSILEIAFGNGVFVATTASTITLTSADGVTWSEGQVGPTSVSFAGDQFLGFSPGVVWRSKDGRTWDASSAFASESLVAGTFGNGKYVGVGSGLIAVSSDAKTWNRVASVCCLKRIAFGNGVFVTIGGMGLGGPGPPHGVYFLDRSADGTNWTEQGLKASDVVFANGQFLAVGEKSYTSSDGLTWIAHDIPQPLAGVAFGNGVLSALGSSAFFSSTDGVLWTQGDSFVPGTYSRIAFGNGTFVAAGASVATSMDASHYIDRPTLPATRATLADITDANGQLIAVGEMGTIVTSPDGRTWSPRQSGTVANLSSVASGGGRTIAVGPGKVIVQSTDGATWSASTARQSVFAIAYGAGVFVISADNGTVLESVDGSMWTERTSVTPTNLGGIAFGSGRWVATSSMGLFTSSDRQTWTQTRSTTQEQLARVRFTGGMFVAVGALTNSFGRQEGAAIVTSPDGVTWTPRPYGDRLPNMVASVARLNDVTFANGTFMAVGGYGPIHIRSNDAITWTPVTGGATYELFGVIPIGRTFVVIGPAGAILQSDPL